MQWPLGLTSAHCEGCGGPLDAEGHHRVACMRSGRVKIRAAHTEKVLARICSEAGARVQENVKLSDLNLGVRAGDERRIEVVASGLPCRGGRQMAVDVTIRGVVSADGHAKPQSHWKDGAAAEKARADKEDRYPEFSRGSRCSLVVAAIEAGGRYSQETSRLLQDLAQAKAATVPAYLRKHTALVMERRWSKMLSISIAGTIARSIFLSKDELRCSPIGVGNSPWLQDVIVESRLAMQPSAATSA